MFLILMIFSDVKVYVITDKEEYLLGEDIYIEVLMENKTGNTIKAGKPKEINNWLFVYYNGERKKSVLNMLWLYKSKYILKRIIPPDSSMIILYPTHLRGFLYFACDIPRYFPVGEYMIFVKCAYTVPGSGDTVEVVSDTVRVRVVEPEGEDREVFEYLKSVDPFFGARRGKIKVKGEELYNYAMEHPGSVYAPYIWYSSLLKMDNERLKAKKMNKDIKVKKVKKREEFVKFIQRYPDSPYAYELATDLSGYPLASSKSEEELRKWILDIYHGKWRDAIDQQLREWIGAMHSPGFKTRLNRLKSIKKEK